MNVIVDGPGGPEQPGVLVGVDGTRIALDAVRWAAAEARLRGLPLRILHAAPYAAGRSGPGPRRAHDILARAFTVARRTEPGVSVTTRRTDVPAVQSLLHAGERARLLVVGMGGGDRPQDVLIGSVALDVSGRATCPVAVVRGAHHARAGAAVLVGVDSPAVDAAALTVAFADAERHGGRLTVLHARHGTGQFREHLAGHDEAARIAAQDRLADELAPWSARFPDVPVELELVHGQPTPALLAAAVGARLVVLGTRGRGAPARALFGSTSRQVLRRCPVPVVVVTPGIALPGEEPVSATSPAARSSAPSSSGAGLADPHDRSQLW
jgi:nucleotide-binding universal stress UspA family protein